MPSREWGLVFDFLSGRGVDLFWNKKAGVGIYCSLLAETLQRIGVVGSGTMKVAYVIYNAPLRCCSGPALL